MQNTTAIAYNRLRPIQQKSIGNIVEEHIRFWSKNKDEQEAKKLARQAKDREFQRKSSKETFELYQGLQPEENAGFLNYQIIERFKENKPYYAQLAKAASKGDIDAKIKLADEKAKIQSAVNINKVYSEKIKTLEDQKRQGIFNPQLDRDIERFKNSLVSGKYRLNADWSLDVYSPALEETFAGQANDLVEDGIVRMSTSQLFNNDFLNASFNKKANFKENGNKIADQLLDTVNGNKQITANTRVKGIKAIKALLAEDSVEARSFIAEGKKKGLFDINKPYGQLTSAELTMVADKYYDENVSPFIQEVDNSLSNQASRLSIARSARALREDKEKDLLITRATDESGKDLTPDLNKPETDKVNNLLKEGGKAFIVKNAQYSPATDKTVRVVGGVAKDGNTTLVLKEEVEEPIVEVPKKLKLGSQYSVRTNRGSEVLKLDKVENDNLTFVSEEEDDKGVVNEVTVSAKKSDLEPVDTGKKRKVISTRTTDDDAEINDISAQIGLQNTQGLFEEVSKVIPVTKKQAQSTIENAEKLADEGKSLVEEGEAAIKSSKQIEADTSQTAKELRDGIDQALNTVKKGMSDDEFEAFLKKNNLK